MFATMTGFFKLKLVSYFYSVMQIAAGGGMWMIFDCQIHFLNIFFQAVCCSDHLHCCPSGYTCDVTAETCNKPVDESATPATPVTPVTPLDYVWCDSTHACYDGQTCCTGPGGMWTCCPYPQVSSQL